jgi:glycosyltransferase involved in cell wall biosynthesis
VTGRNARVLRSGIRLGDFHPGAAHDGVTVGMVACLKPQKAPLDFVEVAAEVLEREPDTRFVLVGDGDLRPAVEARLRARGIAPRVTLTGWRRDIPDLMRSFDVLLHTSRWEGLPRVFPEAMATAIPIVATRVDGAPEAIEDGVNGRLFDPGDLEGMAGAVVALVRDRDLRERMGRAGLAKAAGWDIDQMVRSQEALYEELRRDGIIRRAAAGLAAPTR